MNRRTRLIIAATVVALGLGVMALGFLEDESTVRYVIDVHQNGESLRSGSYTLLGIPQPEILPDGAYNPEYASSVPTFLRWSDGSTNYVTKLLSTVELIEPGLHRFTISNETTTTGSQTPVASNTETTWDLVGDYQVFQVDDFESGLKIWAAFGGVLNGDVQPKPSQLQGNLAEAPPGALIWMIEPDGYTVGCSSKFLPDDVQDRYDRDGDGYTD